MSRVATTQYGADVDTQFQWATDDNDPFDRELDMSFLARALERHDHSNARGLAVTRIGNNVITTAMFQAQSVDTAALLNLAVTTPKLADLAVTKPKLANPLIQTANTIAGGLRLADSTAAFTSSWFVDANGNVGLTSNQSGLALNVMQNNNIVIGQSLPVAGLQTRLTIAQTLGTSPYGMTFVDTSNTTYQTTMWQVGSSGLWILAGNFHVVLDTANAAVRPNIDNGINLGLPSTRWLNVHTVNGTFGGAVTVSGGLVAGALTSNGAIASTTGIFAGTTLSVGGASTMAAISCTTITTNNNGITMGAGGITGATGAFTSTLSCAGFTCTSISCTTINTNGNSITMGAGNLSGNVGTFAGLIVGGSNISVAGQVNPSADNVGSVGTAVLAWGAMFTHAASKDSGGAWAVLSDERSKIQSSFRPFKDGLAHVLALNPEYFKYNGKYGTRPDMEWVGLRAEHAKEVAPHLTTTMMIPETVDDEPEEMLLVDPSNLPYMLINAVKELQAQIDDLKRQVQNRRN